MFRNLLFITLCLSTIFSVNATGLSPKAKEIMERRQQMKEREKEFYDDAVESRSLDKCRQFMKEYPTSEYSGEIRRNIKELELWRLAESRNSAESYQNYLDSSELHWYATEARKRINAINRELERRQWETASEANTVASYEYYLANSTGAYRTEAETALKELHAMEEWPHVAASNDEATLQDYINRYPSSPQLSEALCRLSLLKAMRYYRSGNLSMAYDEFSRAGAPASLQGVEITAWNECREYHDYSGLTSYTSVAILKNYISCYPSGRYTDNVRDLIALNHAQNLSDYATEADYRTALSYVRSQSTRTEVNNYIDQNKKKQKERRRSIKAYNRLKNGGWLMMGIEFADFGYAIDSDMDKLYYYNVGVHFRLGNYRDPVQFTIGAKPGILHMEYESIANWGYGYYDFYNESETKFHMPVFGQLKINLFSAADSKFYIMGQFQYNVVRVKEVENKMSWVAGAGFSWKHIDLGIYYRSDIDESTEYYSGNSYYTVPRTSYIGASLTWYYKL